MSRQKLINIALTLTIITLSYNLAEGLVSVFFGISDETLVLLGFGVDSFVEIISAFGILHMVLRMRKSQAETPDSFEKNALRITGTTFYLLTIGLIAGVAINLITSAKPETTLVGIIVSSASILVMWFLMRAKQNVGKKLKSNAIIADANCTKTCFYLSFILLASSLLYEFTGINWVDSIGSIGIAWFAFTEGREAFEKARLGNFSCGCEENCH
ncbi:MAG: cation transporter [Bacteroidales bacterium]|jgi:divalent metal cation (Fe/Co/Zn/Cd) transporter|nr:cation transporter [Bacteroidales bacterium]MDD4385566.1 cation transporter [Bacteroidales bacterium]